MNESTRIILDGFIKRPSSSVIIKGDENDGVEEIINSLCARLLGNNQVSNRVELKHENGKAINIEQARFLKTSMQTKLNSINHEIARVGIVWRADTATREAQNALLKLIEEPVANTVLILQCNDTERLLATVRSRCQLITILPVEKSVALEIAAEKGIVESDARKIYTLSYGKSSLFHELLSDSGSTPASIVTAKSFMQESVSSRLQRIKEFDDTQKITELLDGIDIVTHAALQTPRKDADKFYSILTEIRTCKKLLAQNALLKLVYLRLCVNL